MLNQQQYDQLLKPLNPVRVAKRSGGGRQLSYLEAWDVKAHLNRIFGFLNWSADVQDSSLAFEENRTKKVNGMLATKSHYDYLHVEQADLHRIRCRFLYTPITRRSTRHGNQNRRIRRTQTSSNQHGNTVRFIPVQQRFNSRRCRKNFRS
jgi:hypothetical protein